MIEEKNDKRRQYRVDLRGSVFQYRTIWGLVSALWMVFIYSFSAQPANESSQLSSGVTENIIRLFYWKYNTLSPDTKVAIIAVLHTGIRKAAHMFLYAMLAACVTVFIKTYITDRYGILCLTLGTCLLYAALDEFHQFFVSGRACMFTDVLIDLSGACIGFIIVYLILKKLNY